MKVLKTGGRIADDNRLISFLADELASRHRDGEKTLLIHGGGKSISALQEKFNLTPNFIQGLRQTTSQEMPLVDMALSGLVNKKLVRLFHARGIPAWGMCGADAGILTGRSVAPDGGKNLTGHVTEVSIEPIKLLWKENYFPILAPPAMDADSHALNINADEAALSMAIALRASHLIFMSDVPGVLRDGRVIKKITPKESEKLIEDGVVTGGMIPKLRSSVAALKAGVGTVIIAAYDGNGCLSRILEGEYGTTIR